MQACPKVQPDCPPSAGLKSERLQKCEFPSCLCDELARAAQLRDRCPGVVARNTGRILQKSAEESHLQPTETPQARTSLLGRRAPSHRTLRATACTKAACVYVELCKY